MTVWDCGHLCNLENIKLSQKGWNFIHLKIEKIFFRKLAFKLSIKLTLKLTTFEFQVRDIASPRAP